MMQIDKNWDFEEALQLITERYPPVSLAGGQLRNRQIEAWGQLVGRTRALAEFDLAIEQHGSLTAFGKQNRITVKTLRNLRQFYASLPDDRGRARIYPGQVLGEWRLLSRIGSGGNAEVWRAKGPAPRNVALKILKRARGKSLKRFLDEIEILKRLGQRPGILPMLDYALLEDGESTEFVWIALPIATLVLNYIENDSASEEMIEGIRDIATTLAELHNEGIAHRDIKPDNLYVWQEQWVISDFGIASFPNKEALTSANKKLGPLYYIAPEMLHAADTADGGKADVYSLAKTLWVLLTGQKYPPPGEQRIDVEALTLSTYIAHPRAYLLDRLVEACTRHNPKQRPSMSEVAAELHAWLEIPSTPIPPEDLSNIAPRIAALIEPAHRDSERRKDQIEQARELLNRFRNQLQPMVDSITRAGLPVTGVASNSTVADAFRYAPVIGGPQVLFRDGVCNVVQRPGRSLLCLWSGVGIELLDNEQIDLVAAHLIASPTNEREVVWFDKHSVLLGSAQQGQAFVELIDGLTSRLPAALEQFAILLEQCKSFP